jgi:hypothetical protein
MTYDDPVFSVRSLGSGPNYVNDVIWSDGTIDQLGRFASPEKAARWIEEKQRDLVARSSRDETSLAIFGASRPPAGRPRC